MKDTIVTMKDFDIIREKLQKNELTRIVAVGSSNTERGAHSEGHYNWFDWLDIMLSAKYGRKHTMINTGISGQTTDQVKDRFERDVLFYQPDILFITLGGNDCNPEKSVAMDTFRANLTELVNLVREKHPDCYIILQTYYSFDIERMEQNGLVDRAKLFPAYMDITRQVAKEQNTFLLDNLARWENLRTEYLDEYRKLMRDNMHVNKLGNMVWGLDVGRLFGGAIPDNLKDACQAGLEFQNLLDNLSEPEETD